MSHGSDTNGGEGASGRFSGVAEDCYQCVLAQARSAAAFAELDEAGTERVVAVAEAELQRSRRVPMLVQHIVRRVADAVLLERGEGPDFDIYAEVKELSNQLSQRYVPRLQEVLEASEEPLRTGLQIAAAGNIIDFGAREHASLDLEAELERLLEVPFAHCAIEALEEALEGAVSLLYLCDNCGEIVFDMLLIRLLRELYPRLRIVAAVRGKPILNDATPEDASAVGLDRLVETVSSGSIYPGTVLPETTEEFQRLFASADAILAKGQGNFETLLPLQDPRLFSLLRIKCDFMARLAGVPRDSLVLMQGGTR